MTATVRRSVWEGKVFVEVVVEEPCSIGAQSYLLSAHRVTYLPLHLPQILDYFEPYLDPSVDGDWWFEFQGKALNTSRPIGLLYDLLDGSSAAEPFVIHLRRGEQPNGLLTEYNEKKNIEINWINAFKESAYIRDGSSRAVLSLPKADQENLWHAISNPDAANGEVFFSLFDNLLTKNRDREYKVPVRIYESTARIVHEPYSRNTTIRELAARYSSLESLEGLTWSPFRLHGIQLPMAVALGDVYKGLTYPDGFLHLVLVDSSDQPAIDDL